MTQTSCTQVDTRIEKFPSKADPSITRGEIQLFKSNKPVNQYIVIGKIESHIQRNLFFGGVAHLEDEGYKELRQKAREMGGNAIIIDDVIETKAAELSHVHIWATVIKIN